MLNGIHLIDFANHRDTRLTFGRMTALVGQNGSGKSNAMRAIVQLAARYNGVDPSGEDERTARKGTQQWLLSGGWNRSFRARNGELALLSTPYSNKWFWKAGVSDPKDVWLPPPGVKPQASEVLSYDILDSMGLRAILTNPGEIVEIEGYRQTVSWESRHYKPAGSDLRAASYSEALPPALREDCRNLAWMISYLKGDKDDVFAMIVDALKIVIPIVRRVRHRPVPVTRTERKDIIINKQARAYDEEQLVMGQELRFDMASGDDMPAAAISEGTLMTLAILTAVIQSADDITPQTILLDDIDSGLHPHAQRVLIGQLRHLQRSRPELQIIFSSHSPYIIDEMRPEEVWLFATDKEGCSQSAKLSDHPDAKRALEVLTTGEFWSAEGEEWVLDPAKRQTGELQPAS